uniref:Uncharacterized protein n=2 Tax=Oxyrrhis marina TaxID=2969 RepID=A0A7S4LPE3_OXYMA
MQLLAPIKRNQDLYSEHSAAARTVAKKWLFFQILVQLVLILAASIGAECAGAGVAAYPQWVLAVIAIAGAMAFATEAHQCCEAGYLVWGMAMTMPSTVLNVADLCTDALSAGSMIASSFCEGCRMEEAWRFAWSRFCQLAS